MNGQPIKAVVQVTKQSFAYVVDRVTGKPVWPIEERPAPASTVPGEKAAVTQPTPTKPPAFDRQGITDDDLIDFTPELRAEAKEMLKKYVTGPIFTPPSIAGPGPDDKKGTILMPGSVGGADWTGAAFDPETGMLFVPSMTNPFVANLLPGEPRRARVDRAERRRSQESPGDRAFEVRAARQPGPLGRDRDKVAGLRDRWRPGHRAHAAERRRQAVQRAG